VFFYDQLAAQRDHEQDAKPSTEEGQRKDARGFEIEAEKINAGRVKMTPEAIDWPALPTVWTMLFSRMLALPKALRIEMERTEMGMEAATVSPARRPT